MHSIWEGIRCKEPNSRGFNKAVKSSRRMTPPIVLRLSERKRRNVVQGEAERQREKRGEEAMG